MLSDIIENQKNTISAFEQNLIQARESMSEEDVQTNILCIKNDAIVSLKHYCNIINDIYEGKSELAVEDQNKIKDSIQAEKNLNLDYEENYKAKQRCLICPNCGYTHCTKDGFNSKNEQIYECKYCNRKFSIK